jgi:hypothetical protein
LAIACDRRVTTSTGKARADAVVADLPKQAWQRRSAGDGAKGPRFYEWAWIQIDPDTEKAPDGQRWLLARRNPDTAEIAYYRCYAPKPVPLTILIKVAGRRWTIEENFQTGKGLAGLDEHQVRNPTSWRRWTILAMIAHAILAALAAMERPTPAPAAPPADLIALTRNEIRHLFSRLVLTPIRDVWHMLRCSTWRRRHQHRAKTSHYRHRTGQTP